MNCSAKCELILEWADVTSADFDTSIVKSILEWGKYDVHSFSQKRAIDNIYKKWRVGQWAKKNDYL